MIIQRQVNQKHGFALRQENQKRGLARVICERIECKCVVWYN